MLDQLKDVVQLLAREWAKSIIRRSLNAKTTVCYLGPGVEDRGRGRQAQRDDERRAQAAVYGSNTRGSQRRRLVVRRCAVWQCPFGVDLVNNS